MDEQSRDELRRQAEADRKGAEACDNLPAIWWRLYQGCRQQGFTVDQSFELVRTFVSTLQTGGDRGTQSGQG